MLRTTAYTARRSACRAAVRAESTHAGLRSEAANPVWTRRDAAAEPSKYKFTTVRKRTTHDILQALQRTVVATTHPVPVSVMRAMQFASAALELPLYVGAGEARTRLQLRLDNLLKEELGMDDPDFPRVHMLHTTFDMTLSMPPSAALGELLATLDETVRAEAPGYTDVAKACREALVYSHMPSRSAKHVLERVVPALQAVTPRHNRVRVADNAGFLHAESSDFTTSLKHAGERYRPLGTGKLSPHREELPVVHQRVLKASASSRSGLLVSRRRHVSKSRLDVSNAPPPLPDNTPDELRSVAFGWATALAKNRSLSERKRVSVLRQLVDEAVTLAADKKYDFSDMLNFELEEHFDDIPKEDKFSIYQFRRRMPHRVGYAATTVGRDNAVEYYDEADLADDGDYDDSE